MPGDQGRSAGTHASDCEAFEDGCTSGDCQHDDTEPHKACDCWMAEVEKLTKELSDRDAEYHRLNQAQAQAIVTLTKERDDVTTAHRKAHAALCGIAEGETVQCLVARLGEGTLECRHDTPCAACAAAQRVEKLRANYEAQGRELERWKHGQQIEGDYVCPDSLALTESRAEVEKLRAELAEALHWEDVDDEWTEAIQAAHPSRTNDSATHDNYGTAMRMVGSRHSKGELVSLVCWLLTSQRHRENG